MTIQQSGPQVKTIRTQGRWEGQYRTALQVREFSLHTAEPEKLGGDNSAPTPMEYVLASFNGCISVVIELVAKEMTFDLSALEFATNGEIDQRGLFGTADVSPHFQSIAATIAFASAEPPERTELLKIQVLRRCPAYNLLKDAGIPITIDWIQRNERSEKR